MNYLEYFDPMMLDVSMSFFAVAAKYAGIFAICGFLVRMVTRAFAGKERFF